MADAVPLANLRHRKLLSQRDLAARAGVALSTIHLLEAGKTDRVTFKVMRKVSDALETPPEAIAEFRRVLPRRQRPRAAGDIVAPMTLPAEPLTTLNITDLVSGPIPPRVQNAIWPNMVHTRVAEVVEHMGPPPWSVRLIQDERNLVTLIANPPGTGNRPHWHKDFDEWWVILAGRLRWELTGGAIVEAAANELVWVPRGTVHHIVNVGDDLSLRLAISMPPAVHYFSPCEQCGYTDDGPRTFW